MIEGLFLSYGLWEALSGEQGGSVGTAKSNVNEARIRARQ